MAESEKHPLDPPSLLSDLARTTLPEQLKQVIDAVGSLSESVKFILEDDMVVLPDRFEDLDLFRCGLLAIRENRIPTDDQLGVLAHPHSMLDELQDALRSTADPKFPFASELTEQDRDACTKVSELLTTSLRDFPDQTAYLHVALWRTILRYSADDEPELTP